MHSSHCLSIPRFYHYGIPFTLPLQMRKSHWCSEHKTQPSFNQHGQKNKKNIFLYILYLFMPMWNGFIELCILLIRYANGERKRRGRIKFNITFSLQVLFSIFFLVVHSLDIFLMTSMFQWNAMAMKLREEEKKKRPRKQQKPIGCYVM